MSKSITAAGIGAQTFTVCCNKENLSSSERKRRAGLKDFQATLVSALVEQALPKSDRVFGKGVAGGFARSMFARHLGEAVAARDSLGLTSRLASAMDARQVAPTPDQTVDQTKGNS